jgi:predicted dehydrogenase
MEHARERRIGVGIIGASPERGWAVDAHIPALRASAEFELRAVSTSRSESAKAASRIFDIPLAFDNHQDLLAREEVDLAVVAVKVPFHLELVTAALQARKPVYCEWPLANGTEEAEQLSGLSRRLGVFARVGLQARSSPIVNYVRTLVSEGYLGRVLSSSIVASGINWGADVLGCYQYLLEQSNGASMLTIPFSHTVDAMCWVLGEFSELNATLATLRPTVRLLDNGDTVASNIADQVAVTGTLQSGAVASVHFRGGLSRGTGFLWEICGTDGDLLIESVGGHIQMLPLSLKGAKGGTTKVIELPVPVGYRQEVGIEEDSIPYNLAQAYVRVAGDFVNGTDTAPNFNDALVRHRMIDAIEQAARTGSQASYDTSNPGAVETSRLST